MNFNPNNSLDEIIENLYLGSYEAAMDISLLKEKGIKKVLSIMDCKDGPNYKSEEFIHKKLKVDDFVVINITIIDRVVRNTNLCFILLGEY